MGFSSLQVRHSQILMEVITHPHLSHHVFHISRKWDDGLRYEVDPTLLSHYWEGPEVVHREPLRTEVHPLVKWSGRKLRDGQVEF
jgi:hypothetical protein